MDQKYSPEMRERALRMLDEAKPDHPNLMTAVRYDGTSRVGAGVAGVTGVRRSKKVFTTESDPRIAPPKDFVKRDVTAPAPRR